MSYATLDADVAAWLVTLGLTRMVSDLRTDQKLTAGATYFQLRVQPQINQARDSNVSQQFAQVDLRIVHRLADWQDERAYSTAARLTLADTLTTYTEWLASVASAHEVTELGGGPIDRVGHVVRFDVSARVGLAPT